MLVIPSVYRPPGGCGGVALRPLYIGFVLHERFIVQYV
jgi:hypothetical protein